MSDPQASRFWQAGLQSGLLDESSLNACWEAIAPEKRDAPEHLDRRLARQALQLNLLTLWQAQQLLAGRTNGFRVDRYLLVNLIGHGGMGRVYLARDSRLNRLVALKILSPERMNNPRAIARFQREARVGAQLQHEHLVRIYDFGESNGRYYLVMEYIDGKTIGSLITSQGPMPPATAARLTRQIALGLEHAHRKGLIHRDVNPYNVLVTTEGIAKLADLGLAIDLAEEDRVTREGATVGTFDYVAPEQARHSHSADIRSDIYSLGCTLYHMITGQVPFPSPSLPEKLFSHQAMEPAPVNERAPNVPAGLADVVRRMMKKRPEDRYPTPLQVAQALEPYVDEFVPVHEEDLGPPILRPERRMDAGQATIVAEPPPSSMPGEGMASQLPSAEADALPSAALPSVASAVDQAVREELVPSSTVSPSVLTPIEEEPIGGSGEYNDPLLLNLGPEPSLSESLSKPKPWFGGEKPAKPATATASGPSSQSQVAQGLGIMDQEPPPPEIPGWLLGLAATAVVVTLLLVGFAATRWLGGGGNPEGNLADRGSKTKDAGEIGKTPKPTIPADSAITVVGGDGEEAAVADLVAAMTTAMKSNGWVVLHNSKPIELPAAERNMSSLRGSLRIRAAEGVNPVVIVDARGGSGFLTAGQGTSLVLDGLKLVGRYSEKASNPPPLIQWAGPVELSHCSLTVEGNARVAGSTAVKMDGGSLKVENCWFQGFDAAIDVLAAGGTTTMLTQSMFVPPVQSTGDDPSGWGWGIAMRHYSGGRAGSERRLILNHCTVAGAGLLKLSDFTPDTPLRVDIQGCALKTQALAAVKPASREQLIDPKTIHWTGERNQLDIAGPAWAVPLGPGQDGSPFLDRDAWMKLVQEESLLPNVVTFKPADGAGGRTNNPSPLDYAIERTGQGESSAGAEAAKVGPVAVKNRPAQSS